MKQFMVRIPEPLYREIERQAKSEQRSINQMANMFLQRVVETAPKPAPSPLPGQTSLVGKGMKLTGRLPSEHSRPHVITRTCKTHNNIITSGNKCLQKDCKG